MQRLLSQIGRSQRLAVINLVKRAPEGLPVNALAIRIGISYMGVKQVCLALERDGYLDTFRRNRGVGRPELLYRLTLKAHDLFPQADNALSLSLLEQARKLYGAGAPEKILFLHFQERTQTYADKMRGDTPAERAQSLASLREAEGHMAEYHAGPALRIIEHHHPMQALMDSVPRVAEMEREMFQRLLGAPVRREQTAKGGIYECVFSIA